MLGCCSRISYVSNTLSLGTFVKRLPFFEHTTFTPSKINKKSCTTTSVLNNSQFETLAPHQKQQINLYVEALLQWNQKMNLTAVRVASEVMERHVEDSLAIISPIKSSYLSHCGASCENLNLVDVGSGAGLPGLILAIACPGWNVTLLDSMNKRCVFLEHTVSLTGLSNVHVIRERAEDRIWDKILASERYLMLQWPGQLPK